MPHARGQLDHKDSPVESVSEIWIKTIRFASELLTAWSASSQRGVKVPTPRCIGLLFSSSPLQSHLESPSIKVAAETLSKGFLCRVFLLVTG